MVILCQQTQENNLFGDRLSALSAEKLCGVGQAKVPDTVSGHWSESAAS